MSEFKGTKGPWKTEFKRHAQFKEGSHVHLLTDAENFNIGLLSSWVNDPKDAEEAKANAQLIAAAPDLLKALEGLSALYESDEGCRSLPEYRAARAAIAKALGEQPCHERASTHHRGRNHASSFACQS